VLHKTTDTKRQLCKQTFSFSIQYFSHVIGRFSYNADSILYSFTNQGCVLFWEKNQELRILRNRSSTQETEGKRKRFITPA